jgi:hypothetical protein
MVVFETVTENLLSGSLIFKLILNIFGSLKLSLSRVIFPVISSVFAVVGIVILIVPVLSVFFGTVKYIGSK